MLIKHSIEPCNEHFGREGSTEIGIPHGELFLFDAQR